MEIPKNIKDKLTIVPVRWIDEVLQLALETLPVAKGLNLPLVAAETRKTESDGAESGVRAH